MDKNRFRDEVRPYVTVIRMEKCVAFDRIELDAFADEYKQQHGTPPRGAFLDQFKTSARTLLLKGRGLPIKSHLLTERLMLIVNSKG